MYCYIMHAHISLPKEFPVTPWFTSNPYLCQLLPCVVPVLKLDTFSSTPIQRTETTSSQAMEKEGLLRCLQELDIAGVKLASLTTDDHMLIAAYLGDNRPGVKHSPV